MTDLLNTEILRVHSFRAVHSGPRLIVLGAVHGNETCGTRAIERILAELDAGALCIMRGTVTFVPMTNPLACQRRQRAIDRNLNRNLRPCGMRADGTPVQAPTDGFIVFPNPLAQPGNEWFYFARRSTRVLWPGT